MESEIKAEMLMLHKMYSKVQILQMKLPARKNRKVDHSNPESEVRIAAQNLLSAISDFVSQWQPFRSQSNLIQELLNENSELENIRFGAREALNDPYKRYGNGSI